MISWASTYCIDQLSFHYLDAWIKFVSWPILSDGEITSDQGELKSTQKQTISRGGKHKWSSTNWFSFGQCFLTRKKELRFTFLGGKIHVHVGYLFLVFAFPHRDPTEGRELTGSRMKTSVRLTRDSKSQSHIFGREKMGMSALRRGKNHTG